MRLLLLLFVLVGCASARKRADVTFVRDVEFQGMPRAYAGPRTDYALREVMAQKQSPPFVLTWPFTLFLDGPTYRPDVLAGDEARVETWLAHHGWFDAQVTWYVKERRKDRRRRAGVVDVIGDVALGAPTRWAEDPRFAWTGPAVMPDASVRALTLLRRGGRFSLPDVDAAIATLTHALGDLGHVAPKVTPRLEVHPEDHTATVTFEIDPGPAAVLGPIAVTGADLRDPRVVTDVARLREGDPWRVSDIDAAREALYGTGAFDRVELQADPGASPPVTIALTEALPNQLAFGAEIGWTGPFFKPEVHATWSTTNARRRLGQTSLGLATGFGYTPGRAVWLVKAEASRLERRLFGLPVDGSFDLGVRSDIYEYLLPRTDAAVAAGLAIHPARAWSVTVGPRLAWTRLGVPETAADETAVIAALGPGFTNQYGMASLDGALTVDLTRPRERRTNGLWGRLGASSVMPIGVSAPFQRLELDVRAYDAPLRPALGRPVQLLARAEGRALVGGGDALPYPERLFLGGASHFRGFRAGQVGAYDCVCVQRPWARTSSTGAEGEIQRYYLPHGGLATALVGAEAQLHHVVLDPLTASVFAEAGALGVEVPDLFDPARWRVAIGAGVRYDTAVGPFRVDVSVRPIAPEDAGPGGPAGGAYLGCDAYGPRRRAFDMFSEFGRFSSSFDRTFPAVNVFITLGEAM